MQIHQENLSISEINSVKKILSPLSKLGDIHYFHYGINYPDQSCFSLSTDPEYLASWYKHQFPHCGFHLGSGWHLWNSTLPESQLEIAKGLDIAHGIHFIRHKKEKTEVFGFATPVDNPDIYNFYLNNLQLLKKFTQYFLTEAKDLLAKAQNQVIVPPPAMVLKNADAKGNHSLTSFVEQIDFPFNLLSERESECFGFFIKGFSNTEISKKLMLSSKTVDVYINRIKQKLACSTRNDLLVKAEEAGLIEYFLPDNLLLTAE